MLKIRPVVLHRTYNSDNADLNLICCCFCNSLTKATEAFTYRPTRICVGYVNLFLQMVYSFIFCNIYERDVEKTAQFGI